MSEATSDNTEVIDLVSTDVPGCARTDTSLTDCSGHACKWWGVVIGKKHKINDEIELVIEACAICASFSVLCTKFVFQLEMGDKGEYIHYQCLICLKVKERKKKLLGLLSRFLGCDRDNIGAVPKNENFLWYCTKTETRLDGPWSKGFPGIQEKPIKVIQPDQYYPWQKRIIEIIKGPVHDRTVYWIWDSDGNTGKTALCKVLAYSYGAFLFRGKASDMASRLVMMEQMPKICVMNVARSQEQYVSYQSIEEIKDGLIVSGKYEGGQKVFDPPHMFVFANFPPDLAQLSADRWKVIKINMMKQWDDSDMKDFGSYCIKRAFAPTFSPFKPHMSSSGAMHASPHDWPTFNENGVIP